MSARRQVEEVDSEEEAEKYQRLLDREDVIRTRPQFQVRHQVTLREQGGGEPRLIQVTFRNGNVLEGTEKGVWELLQEKIRAAAEASLAEETTRRRQQGQGQRAAPRR